MDFRIADNPGAFFRRCLRTPGWVAWISLGGMMSMEAHADYVYRVGQRDTLSGILHRLQVKPIYGKKGFLSITLKRNPRLASHGGHRIHPGEEIVIPSVAGVEPVNEDRAPATESIPAESRPEGVFSTDFRPYSRLGVRPRYGFYDLSSTDLDNQARARIYSSQAPGIQLSGDWFWSESFRVGFNLVHQWVEMYQASVGTLKDGKVAFGGFDLHAGCRLSSWLDAEVFVGYEGRMFSRGEAPGVANLDILPLAAAGIRLEPRLMRKDGLEFLLGLEGKGFGAFSGSSYSVGSSLEYSIGPVIRQVLKGGRFEVRGIFGNHSQQSSITHQSVQTVGLQLGYQFEVGK
jgi:hypothetical protein